MLEAELLLSGGTSSVEKDYELLDNKPKVNGVELVGELTTEDLGINIPDTAGIKHDIENLTDLFKEEQDTATKGIYIGYINSVTPNRNDMERIIEKAIKSNANMIILRPTINLPQNFVAISSGPNLQKFKDGGKGYMFFIDINEHSDSSEMPSVMSYTTKVNFTVSVTNVEDNKNVEVVIDNVETNFISGINSTSQHAYVLHTKNETPYTPTKQFHPATKDYVDSKFAELEQKIQQLENNH